MEKNYIPQLKQILQASGITQRALAERLGVTFAALNRWLRGHATPHPKKIQSIEKLYRELVEYPAYDEMAIREIAELAEKNRKRGIWKWISGHEGAQDDLLLEHTYNSTAIEGTTFNKHETEAVIFGKKILPDKSLVEHLEVTNHATVLKRILQGEYNEPLSESLLQELQYGLLQGIRQDAGHYSRHLRAIRGVDIALTHPKDIPEEMRHLIQRWKRHKKITLREIGLFHIEFELVHPFGDGNGRAGRLVMALQCLQQSFPPVIIENARKAEYYDVLEYAQRKSEGPFISFLANELANTFKILKKYKFTAL